MLGVNIGFHRLLSHKGLECPKWLEHTLAVLGTCTLQGSPLRWVAYHRRHHHFADEEQDPHSPLVNFFWGHMGWVMYKDAGQDWRATYERYVKDLLRDPFYVWIDSHWWWFKIVVISWAVFFFAGFGVELLLGGTLTEALQFGLSLLIWGVFVRTTVQWHTTWCVNSVAHIWGYRNYDTPDSSRNNALVAALAHGEGWHNNHHADPRSARHGHKWWEIDPSWLAIRGLMALGLAKNVALPSAAIANALRTRAAPEAEGVASSDEGPTRQALG
jgi:stearoyl-CoA desaturase (delta-9 desaturase)